MMKRFSQNLGAPGNAVASYVPVTGYRSWYFLTITFISLFMFVSFTILSGCSGGGGGGGGTTTPVDDGGGTIDDGGTTDTTGYSGSAKVSGTIKLSYLSSSDSAQIESTESVGRAVPIRSKLSKAVDTSTEAVKLYVVGPDGELEDTGISCTFQEDTENPEDRTYECDGVKDGINYIVRYVKLNTSTGKALELKSSAYVPEGGTAPEGDVIVSPQTSVIVKALVDAILSATEGTGIDDEIVNAIISSVKTVIETLVASGYIQIPSMVVDVEDGTTLTDLVGEDTDNEKLNNTAGLILTDDSVDTELSYITASTLAASFNLSQVDTPEEKAALIRKVFNDLLTDDTGKTDDMPAFFYNFFTWHYVSDMTITAGELLQVVIDGMNYDASVSAGAISQVTVANTLALFNTEITTLRNLLALDTTTLTAAQKEILAGFPPVIRGLFPSSMGTLTSSTNLITPQGIALVIFFDEVFMQSISEFGDNHDLYEMDEMTLFMALGLDQYVEGHPAEFTGIEIFGLYLHPGSVWIEGNETNNWQGYQLEALMGGTDLMDLSQFAVGGDPDITSGVDVVLSYPKASGGRGEIAMAYITHEGDPHGYWGIDPWQEANWISANLDLTRVVSDFTSGEYVVNIYDSTTQDLLGTKTFTKTVITGMLDTYVKLLTPAGQPIYPGDDATTEELAAYQDAMNLFYNNVGFTTFAATYDANGYPESDTVNYVGPSTQAKITVSWKAPVVDLPDGVKMFYDIQINYNDCDGTGNCNWNDVWNTWQEDKRVYTTSFTIPALLEKLADPYDSYSINVGVNFVDQLTGEYLGRGGSAYTQFFVGDPIDPTATFKIAGTVNIDDQTVTSTDLRVALIKESMVDNTFTRTIIRIKDLSGTASYSLSPTIGEFLDNAGPNTWFNLILVSDPTDALSAGSPMGNDVMMYWPDYSSGGIWFDTWGGMLRVYKDTCTVDGICYNEEKIIIGSEEITGPKFYIGGGYYVAPDPTSITPVPAGTLAADFTITGNVTVGALERPVVAMIKGSYNSSVGFWTESILSIGAIDTTQYSVTVSVGDFFDADGYPIDAYFNLVLIEDAVAPENQVAVGDPLDYSYVMVYWPDFSITSFWYDTWRGDGELHVVKEIYDEIDYSWSHQEWSVPTSTTVDGPDLTSEMIY